MKVLVVDVGGRHVKILATGQDAPRQFDSGPMLTPGQMAALARRLSSDWDYDAVSIGYPGPVLRGRLASEPPSLGPGWIGFDFEAAFRCPVRVVNDAAMRALGSYTGGGKEAKRPVALLEPDDAMLEGGNVKNLNVLPAGDNSNVFVGGFRLWEKSNGHVASDGRLPARRKRTKSARV